MTRVSSEVEHDTHNVEVAGSSPAPATSTGAERAAIRLYKHRVDQAARVAPALPALAEKRKFIASVRVMRWGTQPHRLNVAPGHIKAKWREVTV